MAVLSLCAVLLVACSGSATTPSDLLLGPEDFPGLGVTEASRETGETSLNEPALLVELSNSDFIFLESLVLFETEDQALNILGAIKGDQMLQGAVARPVEGFEDNTGVINEHLRGEDAVTLFFVQGRALVRITLTGEERAEQVWEIARLAREKSRKQ